MRLVLAMQEEIRKREGGWRQSIRCLELPPKVLLKVDRALAFYGQVSILIYFLDSQSAHLLRGREGRDVVGHEGGGERWQSIIFLPFFSPFWAFWLVYLLIEPRYFVWFLDEHVNMKSEGCFEE